MTTPFFNRLNTLDQLIAKGPAGIDYLRDIAPLLVEDAACEYFYNKLEEPAWLAILVQAGQLQNIAEPVKDAERGTIVFPIWPVSRYLVRIAPVVPQLVLDALLLIPDTENVRVHEDITDAAFAMPVELAVKIIPKAKQWMESPYQLLLPQKLGDLLSRLAHAGRVSEALDLAGTLLAFRKVDSEARPRIADWDYEQILAKHVPDLISIAGLETLSLLSDLLQSSIKVSLNTEGEETSADYSYIWRPAIEDHEQNHAHELKGHLVSAVRNAADSLMEKEGLGVLSSIEQRPMRIFQRIGLYLRSKWPNVDPEGTERIIANPELIDDHQIRHEFYQLLSACFGNISAETRKAYLTLVEKGKDPKQWIDYLERERGQKATDEEGARFVRHWQYEKLWSIRNQLDPQWSQRYDAFKKEFGDLDHPEFASYSRSWWGPTSPKDTKELRTMSVADLVSYLKTWEPPKDEMAPPASAEGLGRELTALVASEPKRFSEGALQFQGLDATYVRSFFDGLANAAKQKTGFTWSPVVELCQWAVSQTGRSIEAKPRIMDRDPDWNWTRKTIANLFETGFVEGEGELPFDLRNKVWSILILLTDDQDITPEQEEGKDKHSSFDPATRSINSTRGVAMHAVVKYALWVRRHIEKADGGKERIKRGFDEMPEVRDVLDNHLDPVREPTWAIRSVYGQWFPWLILLDDFWASQNVSRIFSQEEKYCDLRDVAWETYIVFCAPYDTAFDLLREEYKRAIDQINIVSDERKYLADPAERLSDHLISFYWRGKIDLQEKNNLIDSLYEKAPAKIRRHTLGFIGRSLDGTKDSIAPEIIERLKTLWNKRLKAVRDAAADAKPDELIDFGWWFASGSFDDEWSITHLKEMLKLTGSVEPDHMVMKRLVKIADKMPVDAVECLGMIVEGDKEGWRIQGWIEDARTLLLTALKSPDEKAKQAAIDLIHRMGARGYLQFRDLLGSTLK